MALPPAPDSGPLTPNGYCPRLADGEIDQCLKSLGAVLIEGPRGCGKTWAALRHARSAVHLDSDTSACQLATENPEAVLAGTVPRLIDEWQMAPRVWNEMRHACDRTADLGQFLLTGSVAPPPDPIRHSGAGRVARRRLRPMSLTESGLSNGLVSLDSLLAGEPVPACVSTATLKDVAEAICVGGWPWLVGQAPDTAQRRLRGYIEEVCRVEVSRASQRGHNPLLVNKVLVALASNVATTASIPQIAVDAKSEKPPSQRTVRAYLVALERLFVLEDAPAWWPTALRSSAQATQAPKRHFVDPSLPAAALRIGPRDLLADPNACGRLFESLVVRDLRVYGEAQGCGVYHLRLSDTTWADAIIQRDFAGEWIAVNASLSCASASIDAAAAALLRVADTVVTDRYDPLSALLVVTPAGRAYTRPDGVGVVPLTVLRP